ncbi:MAG: lamin tail domain-containing protein [Patescibacteria group bacterium]|nr:lamin tail domain-containing protein [Patescibacteria group bacterium]
MGKTKYLLIFLFSLICVILGTQKTHAVTNDPTSEVGVVINEVMANAPTPEDKLEWVELYNPGDIPIDLKNWTFGSKVISTTSLILEPGKYLVLARNSDAFKLQWPNVIALIIQISMSLTNSNDTVILKNADGTYQEEFSWVSDTGDNISWERIDPLVSSNNNWAPSLIIGGTPGEKNSVFDLSPPLSPTLLSPQNNMELANATSLEFSWQIQNGLKYEFILSKESDFKDFIYDEPNLTTGKFLTEDLKPGTYYWKVIATNILGETSSEIFSFEISPPIYSSAIIINEIYPDPTSGEEWIELYNDSAEDVNLKNWILEDLKGSVHQYKIDNDLVILAFGYYQILKSQSGITLNNDQDGVRLTRPDGVVLFETPIFSGGQKGWSFARNSTGIWQWTTEITPTATNIVSVPVVEETIVNEEENTPKNTAPIEIKTGEIQNHEDYLVKITGAVVETSGNTFYLDDGSGKAKIYIQAAAGIDKPEMHSGDIFEVTGIVNLYRNIWRVLPQKQDDIKLVKAKEENQEIVVSNAKKSTTKSSTASTAKVATTTAKARAPTSKKVASANTNIGNLSNNIQVGGYKSSFWIEMIKVVIGLSVVFLVILIIKLWKMKKDNLPIGGNFGDDFT